ncbi:MAG: beta-CASP ribonuclease aCPSF1 [Pyrodictiaceae archaeon]
MYKRSEMRNIVLTILNSLPPAASITRIEFEGPEIAVYTRNPAIIIEKPDLMRELAKKLKKRLVIRTDPSIRKSKEETIEIIKSIVPPEAGIKDIAFDDALGEVIVKARKVGLVYGKGKSIYNKLLIETGWRLNVVRAPREESKTLNRIISYMLEQGNYRLRFLREVGERIHRGIIFENEYVRITALGGFMEVGRSAILVETAESRVLLDLGINPGGNGITMFPRIDLEQLRLEELDAVIVTHAHLDHMGLVPYLFKYGYKGPVYATKPTRDLMVLSQLDLLDIMEREGNNPPYTQHEVKKMILHTIPLDYEEVTDIAPDIKLTFYNAGHILGSAMVHLHIGEGLHNILYTGDFKYARTRLLGKAHDVFPRVETLIMESTYGATRQKPRREAELELLEVLLRTIAHKGKVLIPVMAVGRAQEILLVVLDFIAKKRLPQVPVYIDGMIDEVTAIHLSYPELLSTSLQQRIFNDENPFDSDVIQKVKDKQHRNDIIKSREPAIIIATSGMLQGGPSVEYLYGLAEDPRNALVFVSYQVKGTLGRRILDGERELTRVDESGRLEIIKINMEVYSIEGFSGHSDKSQLLAFLKNMKPKPKRIILNHGEPTAIRELAATINRRKAELGLPADIEILTPNVLDSLYLAGIN